jgi:hypothetical protein
VGGLNNIDWLSSAQRYSFDLGFTDNSRPVVSSVNNPVVVGQSLQLTGHGFDGDSEASGGATNSSATNSPLVQLRRLDNAQIVWTSPATNSSRSDTSYSSAPLSGLPPGPYALTTFVNGIPSLAKVIQVNSDEIFRDGFDGNGL